MARAWIYQDAKQVKQHGEAKASWYVGWYEPDGKQKCKSYGPGSRGKQNAEKAQRRVEGELAAGTYQSECRKTWEAFRKEYEEKVLAARKQGTRDAAKTSLDAFQRVAKPQRLRSITSKTLVDFVATRRLESGRGTEKLLSKATINKDIRHVRAALRTAHRWGYLPVLPSFEFEREPKKLPTFITDADFASLYGACDAATHPRDLRNGISPADWWRGFFILAFMTGWRVSSLIALRWEDVDLQTGKALSCAGDNKGGRDQLVPLHPIAIEHLSKLRGAFNDRVFPWNENRVKLYAQFHRLQKAAGIKPERKKWYGFHDLRRGFATYNADRMTADALQRLMGHQAYQTTQKYISLARQLRPAIENLFVPTLSVPKKPDENTGS